MRIAIGNDHVAVEMKKEIMKLLDSMNLTYKDFGVNEAVSCDYPIYGYRAAKAVADGECDRGILICGTGIGMSIAANKVKGIRAALCHDVFSARMSREHNDANVLAMGGRVIGFGPAGEIVRVWVTTDFSHEERHQRRIDKMMALENK